MLPEPASGLTYEVGNRDCDPAAGRWHRAVKQVEELARVTRCRAVQCVDIDREHKGVVTVEPKLDAGTGHSGAAVLPGD